MNKNESGYTMFEMVIILAIVGILGMGCITYSRKLDEVGLCTKANEIVAGIEYTKQAAALTGQKYQIAILEDRLSIQKDGRAIYSIYLLEQQSLPQSILGEYITFDGQLVTGDAMTITLRNISLEKQVRITVGVATGQVRVYDEKIG